MNKFLLLLTTVLLFSCNSHLYSYTPDHGQVQYDNVTLFPVASAVVNLNAQGVQSAFHKSYPLLSLLMPKANAQVAQSSGVVSVTYSNPGATSFTISTSAFMAGSYPSVSGTDLNLGTISISNLDDNSLRVCTGVGAPSNKCNRLYIRVFTLGSNIDNTITGVAGFINTSGSYGVDVFAGSVSTAIGYNASATASTVTNAAQVFSYSIDNGTNRVRLNDTGAISFPVKADLSNAGSGLYEMRLVIQYALGYVP